VSRHAAGLAEFVGFRRVLQWQDLVHDDAQYAAFDQAGELLQIRSRRLELELDEPHAALLGQSSYGGAIRACSSDIDQESVTAQGVQGSGPVAARDRVQHHVDLPDGGGEV
jgi:hypothetical protein